MHDTPSALLRGQAWTLWGPETLQPLTDEVVTLVARRVALAPAVIGQAMRARGRQRYVIVEQLSVTRHAVVYVAVDRVLARDVAIKIHRSAHPHAGHLSLFEAQTTSAVEHPRVVRIFDMGEIGGWLYSVIELCNCDLLAWLPGQPWPAVILRLLEASAGLAHVHALGFVHGDIKPTNILIKHGKAKLADFGHAARHATFTLAGGGTAGYVAPELAEYGPGLATDVFALAVTAWVCLFGNLPHGELPSDRAEAIHVGIARACRRSVDRPTKLPAGMPRRVVRVLERALAPHPDDRASLASLRAGLHAALPRARRAELAATLELRRPGRGRGVAMGLVLGACVVSGGVGVRFGQRAQPQESRMMWRVLDLGYPLARAQIAAEAGDSKTVLAEFEYILSRVRDMSVDELSQLVPAMEDIANTLGPPSLGSSHELHDVWRFIEAIRILERSDPRYQESSI